MKYKFEIGKRYRDTSGYIYTCIKRFYDKEQVTRIDFMDDDENNCWEK